LNIVAAFSTPRSLRAFSVQLNQREYEIARNMSERAVTGLSMPHEPAIRNRMDCFKLGSAVKVG